MLFKELENALHSLAEKLTQGLYGKGRDVDTDVLRDEFEEIISSYEAEDDKNEDD